MRMPSRKAFSCWCLGSRPPPQITYGAAENGAMTLQPIHAQLPMPDQDELDNIFAELVDELGLDKAHQEAMFSLPAEKKWQIYCSKKQDRDVESSDDCPSYYIERVNTMTDNMYSDIPPDEFKSRQFLMENLKTALRTQPMSFVVRFLEDGGLDCLLQFLTSMDYETSSSDIHCTVLGCVKALMNSAEGRSHVLAHPSALDILSLSLATDSVRTKVVVLEMLGAVCLVPGGHKSVLQAMGAFQSYSCERTRFQTLIHDLDRSTGEYKDEVSLKTAIMSFINAALRYGPGLKHLEFRLHLRYEFLMLGIQPIIEKLRSHDNDTLNRHLDFFEMVRTEDEKQFAKKLDVSHVDTRSASSMFDLLRKKLNFSPAYPHLLSILLHFLQLPGGSGVGVHYWQLLDRIVQQITLQTKDGDPDHDPLEIDVKKVVQQLASENTMKELMQKMREVQKENDEYVSKLSKKEHECQVKTEEKEELMLTLNKIRAKLEKESALYQESRAELSALEEQVEKYKHQLEAEQAERVKLEHAVKTGSLPDDAKAGFTSLVAMKQATPPSSAPPPPPPPPPQLGAPVAPPPPPPPGPAPPGAPAPPPAPGLGPPTMNGPGSALRNKSTPKPSQPLKSLNWSKIPENKLKGTVWSDMNETKLYTSLDLEQFEQNFSAYQRPEGNEDHVKTANKAKELSVIDGRRAQNCTILLSKMKMTNSELIRAVLSVDSQEELPKDMCEQLLKFVPSPEEVQLLNEHEHELDQMARADHFLYEISRLSRYEQRLKSLFYKKKFNERMSDAKPKVEAVLEASKEVLRSRKFKQILEVVLAFGNYMNRGQRGNAMGFRLASLNRIGDTKSSVNKKLTLLHYLCEVVERKFPNLLKLEAEICHVKSAAKVNLTELEADIRALRTGLSQIDEELKYQRKTPSSLADDKFVSVMSDFTAIASYNFSELEDHYKEMKEKFEKSVRLFGEDQMQPDEFFGILNIFLVAFSDAQADNMRFRKQREEEERRLQAQIKAEQERQKAKLQLGSKNKNGSPGGKDEKGEFDDLISALRTGDVFGEDMAKLKRSRRKVSQSKLVVQGSRERLGVEA